ncbi:conserved protein of unknown function (plasmid) [Rhodovastum atsumiense]|uniref:Uncharacterized protein n=1 Tax=Rhodovastum atsumiense TaxID=504468 RepID=A0A5M6II94_9PROT|nr:hypothetical protein [Rhodovastum atsumiense]KAA5607934.1 hypothetical protein F1189_31500 [Rhodovastum atsumiense]CAH2605940.1 conserved protein of unknown function [Rhodovastum atsumiense]
MRVEIIPGTRNVVRFPVELRARPSLELLHDLAPDSRRIDIIAEAFGLDKPPDGLRDQADRRTAELIQARVPSGPDEARRAALDALLRPVLETAVAACRNAFKADQEAQQMQMQAAQALVAGSFSASGLQARADALTETAAELTLLAHQHAEEAFGVARAVDYARRGEPWVPLDVHAEAEALFFGSAKTA